MKKKNNPPEQAAELRRRAEEITRKSEAASQENIEALSPEETRRALHELRVHQIEFEMQNEELRRAQAELDASRARYFDLYDLAPVGYCTISEKGMILEANLTAATLLGVARSILVKRPLSNFIPPGDQNIFYRHHKLLFETGMPQAYEIRMLRRDGKTFWTQMESTVAQDADGVSLCRTVIIDITERKQAEATEIQNNKIVKGIRRIFHEAINCETEKQLGDVCLNVAEELTESKNGFIGEIGPDNHLYDITISNPGWEACAMIDRQGHGRTPGRLKIHGLYARVLKDGKSLLVNDPAAHPDSIGIPKGHPPLTAFLGSPMDRDGKTVGMIVVGNRDGGYTSEHQHALESLAPAVLQVLLKKRAEDALIQQSAKLEAANKELESFSYSVSHDLRAPLRAIDGFSRMILRQQGDQFDENTKRQFNVIRDNAQKMGKLIDDLLDFSRLGRSEVSMSRLNVEEITRDVWDELKAINPDRLMDLQIAPAPLGMGDPSLIKQVLINLLSNAIKFSSIRKVTLIVVGAYGAESGNVYYVRDNGIGFDMTYYDKLFGVFQRLHGNTEYEGTGVGLALVKRIIERHGGRVWAEGEVDKGATFYFTLAQGE